MRQLACIFILVYYTLCSLILPSADFSILPKLPSIYEHCKATEDKDMNVFDFVTDHLMNIDGVFDAHDAGDDQKPHQPFDYKVNCTFNVTVLSPLLSVLSINEVSSEINFISDANYKFNFTRNIFRPPIA